MDAALTSEELAGFASCLAQIANVKVVLQGPSGLVELGHKDFVRLLVAADPVLAAAAQRWLDASRAMHAHIERFHSGSLVPAEPFRLGISGHVM